MKTEIGSSDSDFSAEVGAKVEEPDTCRTPLVDARYLHFISQTYTPPYLHQYGSDWWRVESVGILEFPNYTRDATKFGVNRTTLSKRHRGV